MAQARLARSSGNSSFAITQAGFQIQDFAIQVAAGQSAVTAFAQQFPQLAGAFGSFGRLAVVGSVLGTVVAVGVALLPVIRSLFGATLELDDAFDNLEGSVDDYIAAVELARRPTSELRDEFGALANDLRQPLRLAAELSLQDAIRDAQNARDAIAAEFSEAFEIAGTRDTEIERQFAPLLEIAGDLGERLDDSSEAGERLGRVLANVDFRNNPEEGFAALEAAVRGAAREIELLNPTLAGFAPRSTALSSTR